MKRKVQEEIYEETRNLCPPKEIRYFHQAAEDFWREILSLRKTQPLARTVRKK
jgi:hypothetical protein